jgi:hypothetical protein
MARSGGGVTRERRPVWEGEKDARTVPQASAGPLNALLAGS